MKLELVDNWKHAYKLASMQVLAVASALVGFIIANPTFLFSAIAFVPDEFRVPAAIAAALLVFVLVAATRLVKKKPCPPETTDVAADANA